MHLRVRASVVSFGTVFKVCAFSILGYGLAVLLLAAVLIPLGFGEIDENVRTPNLIFAAFLAIVAAPIVAGLFLGVPGWILLSVYTRWRKLEINVVIDQESDLQILRDPKEPNQSLQPTRLPPDEFGKST